MNELPAVARLAANDERLVETTLDLLAFDTQNPPESTAGIVDYVDDAFTGAGLDTQRLGEQSDRPTLLGWYPDAPPALVFSGHVDTVPFDAAEWTRDPLGERDGETVYGRGATDMKGAVAAMVEMVRAFEETERVPDVPLGFVVSSDEETSGGEQLLDAFDAFATEPAACVIGEMTGTPDRPSVAVADKGSIWLTLAATGESAHGSRPMVGENAIDTLYGAVDDLRAELHAVEFDLHPDVTRILTESVAYYAPTVGEETAWRLFERPTVNLGRLSGGTAINSVPTAATAAVDIRLTASVATAPIVERIREFGIDRPGVDVESVEWSEGTFEPPESPLVDAVQQASETVTGERTLARSATGGGDAKALRKRGVPTVEFALGTETAHAVDERTTREALLRTAQTYAELPGCLQETSWADDGR